MTEGFSLQPVEHEEATQIIADALDRSEGDISIVFTEEEYERLREIIVNLGFLPENVL